MAARKPRRRIARVFTPLLRRGTPAKHLFAANMKARRQRLGMTQAQLAEVLSKDRSVVIKLESGESNVTLSTLDAVASALSVPPAALLQDPPDRVD